MNQSQKALALEAMLKTPGWGILNDYLTRKAQPDLIPLESLDALVKQAYQHGVCQGHQDVLNFIKVTISNEKRKKKPTLPENFPLPNVSPNKDFKSP